MALDSSTSMTRSSASENFVEVRTFGGVADGTFVAERRDGTAVALKYTKAGFLVVGEFRDPVSVSIYLDLLQARIMNTLSH